MSETGWRDSELDVSFKWAAANPLWPFVAT